MTIVNQRVLWSGQYIFADSDDADTFPESAPLTGTISFTPVWDGRVNGLIASGTVSIHVSSFSFKLRNGMLMSKDDDTWVEGVQLPAQVDDVTLSWVARFRISASGFRVDVRDLGFESVPGGEIDLVDVIPRDAIAPKYDSSVVRGDSVEDVIFDDSQLVFVIGSGSRAIEKRVDVPFPSREELDSRYLELPEDASDGQVPRWDAEVGAWVAIDPPSSGGGIHLDTDGVPYFEPGGAIKLDTDGTPYF